MAVGPRARPLTPSSVGAAKLALSCECHGQGRQKVIFPTGINIVLFLWVAYFPKCVIEIKEG